MSPRTIEIIITDDDVTVMKAIEVYMQEHGHSPKKREVVTCTCLDRDYKGARAAKVFERLKLLGLVDHSLNGHCRLTSQGTNALKVI